MRDGCQTRGEDGNGSQGKTPLQRQPVPCFGFTVNNDQVGDDEFGRSTLQNFKSNGVNVSQLP